MDIIDVNIDDKVLDKKTKLVETIVDRTSNSFCITRTKINSKGIDCTNWFDERMFNDTFNLIT